MTMAAIKRMKSIEREKTSIPQFKKSEDTMMIWLNSFLSIFIPSCPLDLIDPAVVNFYADKQVEGELKSGRMRTVRGETIQDEATKFNKIFQRKVIRRETIAASIIMLASVVTVWYLVNYNEAWEYNNNILANDHFNIFSAVLVIMIFTSFLFVKRMDIFQLFGLNTGYKNSPLVKGSVLAAVTFLVLR